MGIFVNDPNQNVGAYAVAENALDGVTPSLTGSGWTDDGGGEYSCNLASGYDSVNWQGLDIEAGALYVVRLFCDAKTSGGISFFLGSSGSPFAQELVIPSWNTGAGAWTVALIAKGDPNHSSDFIIRAANGFIGTISSVSLTKISGLP